jgi:hypothetical protein
MKFQLGSNGYPILDQFSEEGFVDLVFKITDIVENENDYRFLLAASYDNQTVGMGVEVRKGIKSGLDSEMNLIRENVCRKGVRFFSAGKQSDRLIQAIAKLYGIDHGNPKMVDCESFTAIALHQGEIDLCSQPIKIKIFGRDGDPFVEEDYYESFFNVDIPNRAVLWNEKDQDYRNGLLRGLTL